MTRHDVTPGRAGKAAGPVRGVFAAAGLIAERSGALVTDAAGGAWFDLSRKGASSSVLAAPPAHHARLLALSR